MRPCPHASPLGPVMMQTKRDDIVRAYAEAVNIWQELGDRPDRYPTYLAPI